MKNAPPAGGVSLYCGIISIYEVVYQLQQLAVMDPLNHPDYPFPVIVLAHNRPPFLFAFIIVRPFLL